MEIGDIFVINKKDKDGADRLKAEVEYVLGIREIPEEEKNPIAMVSARDDDGIEELLAEMASYRTRLEVRGQLAEKRKVRLEKELLKIFQFKIHEHLDREYNFSTNIKQWAEWIYEGGITPYALVNEKLKTFKKEE